MLIPLSHYRWSDVCKLESQWPTVPILACPMEVWKFSFFLSLKSFPISHCHSKSYVSLTTTHIAIPVSLCQWETVCTIFGVVRQGEIRNDSVALMPHNNGRFSTLFGTLIDSGDGELLSSFGFATVTEGLHKVSEGDFVIQLSKVPGR